MRGDSHFSRRYCGITDRPDYGKQELNSPSIEQKNRRVAEELGICWHEMKTVTDLSQDGWMWTTCSCGDKFSDNSIAKRHRNPDFSTDPLALLRAMKERLKPEGWQSFIMFLWDKEANPCDFSVAVTSVSSISRIIIVYLLTPGALLNAVYEWIGRKK
ncbi:MAG: hypothetical protein WAZ60_23905 [Desulfosalsimonadaceae bacterium]